jgi:hypothetical protein
MVCPLPGCAVNWVPEGRHSFANCAASHELRDDVMRTLCALVYQLGADYAIFIPMVSKVLAKRHIQVPCAPTCPIVLPAGALLCNRAFVRCLRPVS